MSKKNILIITLLATVVTVFTLKSTVFKAGDSSKFGQSSKSNTKNGLRNSGDAAADKILLSAKSGIDIEYLNPCVVGLLEGYATTTEEGVREAFLKWLEKDHLAVLAALEHLDGLVNYYGVSAPEDLVAEYLLKHYESEKAMDLVGRLNLSSNVVRAVLGLTLKGWGNKDYEAAFAFLEERKLYRNYEATRHFFEDQVKSGSAERIANDLNEFPNGDSRKAEFLRDVYARWVLESPEKFAEHVNTLDDLKFAEESVASYAHTIGGEDPEAALEWASSLENRDFSLAASVPAVAELSKQNPERYNEWLNEQNFESDAEKQYYLFSVKSQLAYNDLPDAGPQRTDEETIEHYKQENREAVLRAQAERFGEQVSGN